MADTRPKSQGEKAFALLREWRDADRATTEATTGGEIANAYLSLMIVLNQVDALLAAGE